MTSHLIILIPNTLPLLIRRFELQVLHCDLGQIPTLLQTVIVYCQ